MVGVLAWAPGRMIVPVPTVSRSIFIGGGRACEESGARQGVPVGEFCLHETKSIFQLLY